jgi:hypothetical protein
MPGLIAARPVVFAAVAAALVFLFPAAARAATAGPIHHGAVPRAHGAVRKMSNKPFTYEWYFDGLVYPDTPAGVQACDIEGASIVEHDHPTIISSNCLLDDPSTDAYDLWLLGNL